MERTRNLDQERKTAERVLLRAARRTLILHDKYATGKTYNSLRVRSKATTGFGFVIEMTGDPAWNKIQEGTKPQQTPFPRESDLLTWIAARNIRGRDRRTGQFISASLLAFFIRRAIIRRGIAPVDINQTLQNIIEPQLTERLDRAIQRDINQIIIADNRLN